MCQTPIHVFRSIHLKLTTFSSENADIFLFSMFNGYIKIAENLEKTGLFSNVYTIGDENYASRNRIETLKILLSNTYYKKILKQKYYDQVFVYNLDCIITYVAYNVLKKQNKKIIYNIVEDAPTFYDLKLENRKLRYFYRIIGYKNPVYNADKWWYSYPNHMDQLGNGEKVRLPQISRTDRDFKHYVNIVFEYQEDPQLLECDIIIMEEPFQKDGRLNNNEDAQLFKSLKKHIRDKKIVVKLHPRIDNDRYEGSYNVLPYTSIPWEVYTLNLKENAQKTIITLASTTAISSKIIYGDEPKVVLLFPLLEDKIIGFSEDDRFFDDNRKMKIYKQKEIYTDKSRFIIINNKDELINELNNI